MSRLDHLSAPTRPKGKALDVIDVVRAGWPKATDEDVEYIMWSRTPYPMGGSVKGLYRAASGWYRAQKNKRHLCELCPGLAMSGEYECARCAALLSAPPKVKKMPYLTNTWNATQTATSVGQSWLSSNGAATSMPTYSHQQVAQLLNQAAQVGQQSANAGNIISGGGINPSITMTSAYDQLARLVFGPNFTGEVPLPDGATLIFDRGNYRIEDKDAKVTYRANHIRQFNRYLNASDLLQDFIRDIGDLGARQSDVLTVPVELFINWLIVQAARQDQDKPARLIDPRCRWCQRFITRARARAGILFCGETHMANFMRREALA